MLLNNSTCQVAGLQRDSELLMIVRDRVRCRGIVPTARSCRSDGSPADPYIVGPQPAPSPCIDSYKCLLIRLPPLSGPDRHNGVGIELRV